MVISAFAGIALLLATLGLHGLLSQYVAQRKREIGVRMAIGAKVRDILRLIASQAGMPVIAGLAVGVLLTLALSRYLASLLFGVTPLDLQMFVLTVAALVLAALTAIARPIHNATAVDPGVVLRDE